MTIRNLLFVLDAAWRWAVCGIAIGIMVMAITGVEYDAGGIQGVAFNMVATAVLGTLYTIFLMVYDRSRASSQALAQASFDEACCRQTDDGQEDVARNEAKQVVELAQAVETPVQAVARATWYAEGCPPR